MIVNGSEGNYVAPQKMRRPLIFWSGGLDSTYLVWCALGNGIDIDVVYVDLGQEESPFEIAAIEKLIEVFKDYPGKIINRYQEDYSNIDHYGNVTCGQAFIWMMAYNMIYHKSSHKHVELGYIRGDDFWHNSYHFQKAQKTFNKEICASKIKVIYPLEWMTKDELIKNCNNGSSEGQDILRYCV